MRRRMESLSIAGAPPTERHDASGWQQLGDDGQLHPCECSGSWRYDGVGMRFITRGEWVHRWHCSRCADRWRAPARLSLWQRFVRWYEQRNEPSEVWQYRVARWPFFWRFCWWLHAAGLIVSPRWHSEVPHLTWRDWMWTWRPRPGIPPWWYVQLVGRLHGLALQEARGATRTARPAAPEVGGIGNGEAAQGALATGAGQSVEADVTIVPMAA